MPAPAHLTLGVLARRYGIPIWQVRRVFERGMLPEPGRIGHYRVVATSDLPALERALRLAGYLPAEQTAGGGAAHAS